MATLGQSYEGHEQDAQDDTYIDKWQWINHEVFVRQILLVPY